MVLSDDVFTIGALAAGCARSKLRAKAQKVHVLNKACVVVLVANSLLILVMVLEHGRKRFLLLLFQSVHGRMLLLLSMEQN